MSLEAIRYRRGTLTILDQLRLPHASEYVRITTCEDAFDAIKRMVVRGAPAIAIVAALALAVEASGSTFGGSSGAEVSEKICERLRYLVESRPTAVNLSDAAGKLSKVVEEAAEAGEGAEEVRERYIKAAERMLEDDVKDNRNIGDYGAKWILENVNHGDLHMMPVAVLTHCNTG